MEWNYLSIPKLQRVNTIEVWGRIGNFIPTLLGMWLLIHVVWLKLIYVSKGGLISCYVCDTKLTHHVMYFFHWKSFFNIRIFQTKNDVIFQWRQHADGLLLCEIYTSGNHRANTLTVVYPFCNRSDDCAKFPPQPPASLVIWGTDWQKMNRVIKGNNFLWTMTSNSLT